MHDCKYEEDIGYIKGTLKRLDERINGSIDAFVNHIKAGHRWRTAIVLIAITIISNVIFFAYLFGEINQKVIHNKEAIDEIK